MTARQAWQCTLAAALAALCHGAAQAQAFPAKPIRIIVPYAAGGPSDTLSRTTGSAVAENIGQPVLVENRPGGSSIIGMQACAKAAPDGYTICQTVADSLSYNPHVFKSLPYDADKDFEPVINLVRSNSMLIAKGNAPFGSYKEMIAWAKDNPGRLTYASQGSGSTSHLSAEMFRGMAGLQVLHVPYKGTAPALTDLLAGQVNIMFDNLGVSLQHVRSGKLKLLAVGTEKRMASLPNVPTMGETLPGFVSIAWFGVVGPPKMSAAIAATVSAGIADALKLPDVGRRMVELSAEPMGLTPQETAAFMRQDAERWRTVIRSQGVKLD